MRGFVGKEGGGWNSVPQRLHLSGGMDRGGCVNLAVVPNESRSYFEEFLRLSGAVSMFAAWNFFVPFEQFLPFQPAPAVQWNGFSFVAGRLAAPRVGWSWLRTFWSPLQRVWGVAALLVSQVVLSLCLLSGIFEVKKLFPFLLKKLSGTSAHKTCN